MITKEQLDSWYEDGQKPYEYPKGYFDNPPRLPVKMNYTGDENGVRRPSYSSENVVRWALRKAGSSMSPQGLLKLFIAISTPRFK